MGDVLFNKTWTEYRRGFGDVTADHWLGLDAIEELCPTVRQSCLWVMDLKLGIFCIENENDKKNPIVRSPHFVQTISLITRVFLGL